MTGLEVIGALASIAQISHYTVNIVASLIRIYGSLEAAPARLRSGCDQLDQLSQTVVLIQQNSTLQTQSVLAHVKSLTALILLLEKMLKDMLVQTKKPRLHRAAKLCLGSQREVRLSEAFAQIEVEKTALGLSMLEVNMQVTCELNKGVEAVVEEVQMLRETSSDVKSIRILTSAILSKVSILRVTDQEPSPPLTPTSPDIPGSTWRDSGPQKGHRRQRQNCHHIYENVISTEGACQLNGDVGHSRFSKRLFPKNRYTNIVASGKSSQLNGNISAANLCSFLSAVRDDRV